MNDHLNELREKMIHDTEEFLDHNLQPGSHAPGPLRISAHSTAEPQPNPPDDRPYFFPTWHEWAPERQMRSA